MPTGQRQNANCIMCTAMRHKVRQGGIDQNPPVTATLCWQALPMRKLERILHLLRRCPGNTRREAAAYMQECFGAVCENANQSMRPLPHTCGSLKGQRVKMQVKEIEGEPPICIEWSGDCGLAPVKEAWHDLTR